MANPYYGVTGNPSNQTRGVAAYIRAEYVLIQTAFDGVTTTLATKGAIAGQAWTGTHDFTGGSIKVPTLAYGASGSYAVSYDALNAAVFASANLPGQTGKAGKFLNTDGGTPSWSDTFSIPIKFQSRIDAAKGADIASAATVDLSSATGNLVHVTGTTTITAIVIPSGADRTVVFDGVLTLTHSSNLILPGAANITTAAGDQMIICGDGAGVARVTAYTKASGEGVRLGMVLLALMTPTAAANLDFLNVFSAAYDNYVVIGSGINGSGSSDSICLRFANGGAVDSGANYYAAGGSSNSVSAQTFGNITGNFINTGRGGSFRIDICNVNDATGAKVAMSVAMSQADATPNFSALQFCTAYKTATVATGFRLFWNGGSNFAARGTVRVYGIPNV